MKTFQCGILHFRTVIFICVVLGIALGGQARAVVLLDSGLDGTTASNLSAGGGKALGFTMGGTSFTLDNIQMRLGTNNVANANSSSVISLYSSTTDGANSTWKPSTLLASFITPTFTGTATQNYTLSLPTAFTLSANTTYWVVAYSTNGNIGVLTWLGTSSTPTTSGGVSVSGLSGWFNAGQGNNPNLWTGTSALYNDLVITATAIPEPSAIALLGLGLTGLVVWRRLRR